MAKHRADVAEVVVPMLRARPGVEERLAFGVPAFFVGGKMFACVNAKGFGLKLPHERIAELDDPAISQFGRPGQPMRGWIQIAREDADAHRADEGLIDESIAYVAAQVASALLKPKRAGRRQPSRQ